MLTYEQLEQRAESRELLEQRTQRGLGSVHQRARVLYEAIGGPSQRPQRCEGSQVFCQTQELRVFGYTFAHDSNWMYRLTIRVHYINKVTIPRYRNAAEVEVEMRAH